MAIRSVLSTRTLAGLKETSSKLLGFRGIQTFTLPDLPYDYSALEPAISGEIMQIHHQKHHQTYVTNYNNALEQLDQAVNKGDASTVVKLHSAIKFNGGGAFFDIFFFYFRSGICCVWSSWFVIGRIAD